MLEKSRKSFRSFQRFSSVSVFLIIFLSKNLCVDKADKIAEQIRTERAQQEQRNREDELREMALKLRRKYVFFLCENATIFSSEVTLSYFTGYY